MINVKMNTGPNGPVNKEFQLNHGNLICGASDGQ